MNCIDISLRNKGIRLRIYVWRAFRGVMPFYDGEKEKSQWQAWSFYMSLCQLVSGCLLLDFIYTEELRFFFYVIGYRSQYRKLTNTKNHLILEKEVWRDTLKEGFFWLCGFLRFVMWH